MRVLRFVWLCHLVFALSALFLFESGHAATTTIIDENFQTPTYPNGTAAPAFTGWTWNGSGAVRSRSGTGDGLPGGATNQAIQFEWTSGEGIYDATNEWRRMDVFTLTFNMGPQEWSGGDQRYLDASLLEHDDTLLWTTNMPIPLYNGYGGNPWPAELTFTFYIAATNFVGGTEKSPIRLKLAHTGQRGVFLDNVLLTVPTPPAGTVITLH